ncbi:lysophospholipid acyltransferase family protein [Chitinivorax sp. B]|uniref:lysophospholipid acyltransferase family protein n=1 Tax=Chitinivorax sp. B TaxID=2502235 RepID=UPI0010FA55EB|nr:lysophospholipid acyltransferase family protein [Chitinivorax sp. B]
MLNSLLVAIASLPLFLFHGIGSVIGRLIYAFSQRFANILRANLAASRLDVSPWKIAGEIGKGAMELLVAWGRSPAGVARLVKRCDGWEHVEAALSAKQGIVFVTPHLGGFDIAGRYLSSRLPSPLTAMYRPPKLKWLEPLMNAGRVRGNGKTAPATSAGVRQLFKTLRLGEPVIILPDQAPGEGGGVWAPFFGRPAYTMTLLARLALSSNAKVLMFYGERLSLGRGYAVHIEPLSTAFTGDAVVDATLLNQAVEQLIARCPSQYLWSYNRYKVPAGVVAPTGVMS